MFHILSITSMFYYSYVKKVYSSIQIDVIVYMYVSFYFFRQEHWLLSTRTGQFWSHMVGQKWVKDSTLK